MQVELTHPEGAVWRPDAQTVEGANLTRFMRALGVDSFEALNERASRDPAWFHDALIRFLDYRFERPYERVLDLGDGLPFAHGCVGGVTNVVLNCIDRRRGSARYGHPALVWEGEDGATSTWTFADLDRQTCRLAWGLRRLGIGRGDVVGMYLPNLPHAAAAMLAVAKIGGIVLPMFSGFGADAVAQRLNDGHAMALITVDGSLRRGKPVGAKAVVDEALAQCPGVRHVVVESSGNDARLGGRTRPLVARTRRGRARRCRSRPDGAHAGRRSVPADVHVGHQRQAQGRGALALRLSGQDATVRVLSVDEAKARAVLATVCRVGDTVVIEGEANVMTTSCVRRAAEMQSTREAVQRLPSVLLENEAKVL